MRGFVCSSYGGNTNSVPDIRGGPRMTKTEMGE